MPTYEFRCPSGHDFEKFYRSIGAAPTVVACPVCGKIAERQLSAGAGLVFKGSGFYITDYGKDGKKDQTKPVAKTEGGGGDNSGKSDASPSSAAESGSSGSSETGSKTSSESKASPAAAPTEKPAAKKAKDTE
jgi:putative FmdB family regulatory protein